MTLPSRRIVLTGTAAAAAALLAGCTDDPDRGIGPSLGAADAGVEPEPEPTPEPVLVARQEAESTAVSGDAAALAAAVSGLLLERARVAILTPDDDALVAAAATLAGTARWPVLVGDATAAVPAATASELTRLGVEHVVQIASAPSSPTDTGTDATTGALGTEPDEEATEASSPTTPAPPNDTTSLPAGIEVTTVRADAVDTPPEELPAGEELDAWPGRVLVPEEAAAGAALATLHALGATVDGGVRDPREDDAVMGSLREDPEVPLVALGPDDRAAENLLVMGTMAQRAPELPGGGVTMFPHRRLIALYGHPGAPVLGLLGEQGPEGSVRRVNTYVERYSPLVEEQVVPAFEIITTVADVKPGPRNDYSLLSSMEHLQPWVQAAADAGVYVVLDLQPGRTDFLTQAKVYEELLALPHVGLALDPEWRLGPDERHLVRVGHVEAEEVNAVSEWLAELVREHDLPQKILTLHQFQVQMIRGRDQVRTDHPELAIILHADGQGGQQAKQSTWRALQEDLPEGMWLGWKNFYDEDTPMLSPEQTIAQVHPTPWFISYQ